MLRLAVVISTLANVAFGGMLNLPSHPNFHLSDIKQVWPGRGYPKGEMHGCSHHPGNCYYVSKAGKYTYEQAGQVCDALTKSGHGFFTLPMPRYFDLNLAVSKLAGGGQYWLGVRNIHHVNVWQYDTPADRSQLRWMNFYKHQKHPEPNGNKKGLCVFATHTGAWFDSLCTTSQQRVICERVNPKILRPTYPEGLPWMPKYNNGLWNGHGIAGVGSGHGMAGVGNGHMTGGGLLTHPGGNGAIGGGHNGVIGGAYIGNGKGTNGHFPGGNGVVGGGHNGVIGGAYIGNGKGTNGHFPGGNGVVGGGYNGGIGGGVNGLFLRENGVIGGAGNGVIGGAGNGVIGGGHLGYRYPSGTNGHPNGVNRYDQFGRLIGFHGHQGGCQDHPAAHLNCPVSNNHPTCQQANVRQQCPRSCGLCTPGHVWAS